MLVSFLSAGLSSCVQSCSAQRVLLSIQRTLGICPGCGRWHLNSRSVANCKKISQISWHLLFLIVGRRHPTSLVTCHSHLCCVWPLALCAVELPSLRGQQDVCSLWCLQGIYSQNRVTQPKLPVSLKPGILTPSTSILTEPALRLFACQCSPHSKGLTNS